MTNPLISFALGTLAALFPIANPIGALPIFYGLTATDTPRFRLRQAQKIAVNVVVVLGVFLLGGRLILSFFGLSLGVLQIAGGLIVAHTAWQMVTSHGRITPAEQSEAVDKDDISFTPMAIPMISGPGAIGVVIGQATRASGWSEYTGCLLGIVALGIVLYLCLVLGESLIERMGTTGLGALNRILGFLILAIAVQLMADGVLALLKPVLP
ncbi:MarC family protein [Nodosilinea nodulosa]|uniref:MarC family protein n=1 Tax=Nodosilinea nodulosa TaxID=416001 RepID=UPI0002F99C45|nr:MarC family protein [Nodosilinea nodulosa]